MVGWIFIGRTDAEAETPILWPPDVKSWLLWKDPDAGKDWRQEEKGTTEDEMAGWHHWLNGHEFEQALGDGEGREAWSASVHGVAKSWTQLSNWTTIGLTTGWPQQSFIESASCHFALVILRKKHKIRMLLRNCKTILQLDLFCKKKERINGTESALFPFLAREVYNRTHFSLSSLRVLTLFCTTPLSRI